MVAPSEASKYMSLEFSIASSGFLISSLLGVILILTFELDGVDVNDDEEEVESI